MSGLRLNEKPAIRIAARFIRSYKRKGATSLLFNCEGDEVWFPSNHVKSEDAEGTLLIEEWLYNAKVGKGEL